MWRKNEKEEQRNNKKEKKNKEKWNSSVHSSMKRIS